MRVNVRLDEASASKLEYLTVTTGASVSEVLRRALAVYHQQVSGAAPVASRLVAMAGTADSGRSDISSNYKFYVAEAIEAAFERKHRPPPAAGKARKARKAAQGSQ